MTDRQFQIVLEKLAGIEATLTEHNKLISSVIAKMDAGLAADNDNRKLIKMVENVQKELSSLKDEIIA